jgi:hypothetical protein
MSILSNNGPEILAMYFCIIPEEHVHEFDGSVAYPHGQGFIAAASINLQGYVSDIFTRAIVTNPSSRG